MGSVSSVCRQLAVACRSGENLDSAVEAFRKELQKEKEKNDEHAGEQLIREALGGAVLPHRNSVAAVVIGEEALKFRAHFGHKRDEKMLNTIREVNAAFLSVDEGEMSAEWRRAQLKFLTVANQIWIDGGEPIAAQEGTHADVEREGILYVNEELSKSFLRFSKCGGATSAVNHSVDLAKLAYDTGCSGGGRLELIMAAAEGVKDHLNKEEKPFLIARTVYKVLASPSGSPWVATEHALKVSRQLLEEDALAADSSALSSFLHDIVKILESRALASQDGRDSEYLKVVEILCKVYRPHLVLLADLNWVELVSNFGKRGVKPQTTAA